MTNIICCVGKSAPILPDTAAFVERIAVRTAPQQPLPVKLACWRGGGGRISAWRVTPDRETRRKRGEEPVDPPAQCVDSHECSWVSGYRAGDVDAIWPRPEDERNLVGFRERLGDAGGVFSVFYFNDTLEAVVAVTNITRMEPVYWAETADRVVVGNRALLVHLAATERETPEYDESAFASFLAAGFYTDESVPFKGVRILPPDSAISVIRGRAAIAAIGSAADGAVDPELTDDALDEVAELFADAMTPMRETSQPIQLGLTGGKDSRLLAAALKAAGAPFKTFIVDYGEANAADVCASIDVAARLGVEHEVRTHSAQPADASAPFEVDPLRRARETLFVADGMLSGYENVPKLKWYAKLLVLGGNGGELLRGGYAKTMKAEDRDEAAARLFDTFGRFASFLRPELAEAQQSAIFDWVDQQPAGLTANELLDRFYLHYRCGRWSAAARAGMSACKIVHQPFFDALLARRLQQLPVAPRLDERLIYGLLRRLAPEAADLPFANAHWQFFSQEQVEKEKRDFPLFFQKPAAASRSRINRDWRTRYATQLRDEFRRQIFESAGSAALFEIVDRQRLAGLFDDAHLAEPVNKLFVFSLYTLSVLLSSEWLTPSGEGRVVMVDPMAA